MTKYRQLLEGNKLPQDFLDAIQELIGSYVSPNFAVTIPANTTLRVVASADNGQVSIAINGKWRWVTANVDAAAPGGLTTGDNPVFVAASANSFANNPTPPPSEIDSTDYTFRLIVLPVGQTPTGTGAQALWRQVGVATWDGAKFTQVKLQFATPIVPSTLNPAGTLGTRPAATAVPPGTTYLATDDHGGRKARSDGAVWTPEGPPVNGEWPLGAVAEWPWAAGSIPAYTALPYAQPLLRATYPDLATLDTASGTPHGVLANNIVMPDYRGRVGVGKDDMGGAAANRITAAVSGVSGATLGAVFGSEGITLTTGQLPAHNHGVTGAPTRADPGHGHPVSDSGARTFYLGNGGSQNVSTTIDDSQGGTADGPAWATTAFTGITVAVGTLGTANAGSGSAHQNTQPSIIVSKLMRVL